MAQKQIKQYNEETAPASGDWYLMQKASSDETVKVDAANLVLAASITPAKRTGGFYIGQIAGATLGTTGNKSITGVGFTPKLVRFYVGVAASSTVVVGGHGAMTSAAQHYETWATDTSASTQFARNSSTAACIGWVSAGSSTPVLLCNYVSMNADGFTINVSAASATFPINYECYG